MAGFDESLALILRHEGGFSDHPRDPGGITMMGVTKRTWQEWTGKPATKADMRALTVAKVAPLYKARYWNLVRGDDLPPALALCVFDHAVNAGPGRAARMLQSLVNASVDGQIGPATLRAVQALAAAKGLPELIRRYQNARRDYYRSLGTFATFGRGWLRRCDETETAALRMIP